MEEVSELNIGLLALILGLLSLSFAGTGWLTKARSGFRIIDFPTDRSSHETPTPRGGGIAIVVSWYLGITYLLLEGFMDSFLFYSLLPGVLIAAISLLDDIYNLKPATRICVQFLAVGLSLLFLVEGGILLLPVVHTALIIPVYIVLIFAVLWFVNLYNFLDGIDGYASIEAVFMSAGMFYFTRDPLLLVLAASVLGFLYWNWPRAKIFLGDVGSTQLGFILAVLGLNYHGTGDLNIGFWILLSSVFWFDGSLTLFRRMLNREKLFQAHKRHAYQRFVQAGNTHLKTDIYLLILDSLILGIVIITNNIRILLIPGFVLVFIVLLAITLLIDRKVPFH